MLNGIDLDAARGAIEGYSGRSIEIASTNVLDVAEETLIKSFKTKGFSFPTNEGMRKITKEPEINKLESDKTILQIAKNIRKTIGGVSGKDGGLYAGTNAFHHGHLAYLTKSEAIMTYDMNPIIPYGFAFIVGLVGGTEKSENFRQQICEIALNPKKVGDYFAGTKLENSGLLSSNLSDKTRADLIQPLFRGIMTTMDEFNPAIHGKNIAVPPVFCWNEQSYNYFRQLILKDKVAGMTQNITSKSFIGNLANAVSSFGVDNLNTLYFSSIFDPRFAGGNARKTFVDGLMQKNIGAGIQIIESFLNSGWVVYDLAE